jgi:hypothetical protein
VIREPNGPGRSGLPADPPSPGKCIRTGSRLRGWSPARQIALLSCGPTVSRWKEGSGRRPCSGSRARLTEDRRGPRLERSTMTQPERRSATSFTEPPSSAIPVSRSRGSMSAKWRRHSPAEPTAMPSTPSSRMPVSISRAHRISAEAGSRTGRAGMRLVHVAASLWHAELTAVPLQPGGNTFRGTCAMW